MTFGLDELIAPLARSDFRALLRRRALSLQRGASAARYGDLLSWPALRGLLEQDRKTPDAFRVTRESGDVPAVFYTTLGEVDLAKLDAVLAQGASVIYLGIERRVPALAALCADIAARLGESSTVHAVMTMGRGAALALHYDAGDLLIVQLEGAKRWQVFGPPVAEPARKNPPPQNLGAALVDETLRPGDALLLPAGYWHHCDNGPERSLHLGIAFVPPTGAQALRKITRRLMGEKEFRAGLTRLDDAGARAALEAALRRRLIAEAERFSLPEFPDPED